MASEIGNKGLLRSIGRALGIIDTKVAPSMLDTSQVVAAANVDLGWASYETWSMTMELEAVAGESNWIIPMVGPDLGIFSSGLGINRIDDCFYNAGNFEIGLMGFQISVTTNLAGATAMAGNRWDLRFLYGPAIGSEVYAFGEFKPWFFWDATIVTNQYRHPWQLMAREQSGGDAYGWLTQRPIWVPRGCGFGLSIDASANAAANTFIQVIQWGVKTPKGISVPYIG